MSPEISIIIPVFNGEKLLKNCLSSALAQTERDIEIILVDDGSTDASGEICAEYASKDARVKYLRRENGGVSLARNAGLGVARGEFVAFADADDTLAPGFCAALLPAMREGASIAACAHVNVRENGERSAEPMPLAPGKYGREDILRGLVLPLAADRVGERALNGYIWRYMFRRSVIEEHALSFCGPYLEDELFLLEYLCLSDSLWVTNEPLYNYYHNPASATRRFMAGFPRVFEDFFAKKEEIMRKYSIPARGWRESTAWAGALIAAANEYAPGNARSSAEKRKSLKKLLGGEPYASAIAAGVPKELTGRKKIVAALIKTGNYALLGALYAAKNR